MKLISMIVAPIVVCVVARGIAGAGDAKRPRGSVAAWERDLDRHKGKAHSLTAMNSST